MANSKISALTSATTPLAGTETLPIVQSGSTVKVAVSDLTTGRTVSAAKFSPTGSSVTGNGLYLPAANALGLSTNGVNAVYVDSNQNVGVGTSPPSGYRFTVVGFTASSIPLSLHTDASNAYVYTPNSLFIGSTGANITYFVNNNAVKATLSSAGDFTISSGNVIQGTAAKGINFTANTPAAGMTSQLLNWYEEGTWTPNQGAGLTIGGAFSSTGRYTRIGRQVSISGTVTGATSAAVAAAGVITSNLPFSVGTAGHGDATNAAVNASAAIICTGTSVTSAAAIAATGTITFSATYFV